jgi:PadR family transcriptional regulator, regulatory protein PadR
MDTIGRREEQILLAVASLDEDAYLVSIKDFLSKIRGQTLSIGAVHIPLRRLEREGYIRSHLGEFAPDRGGRRKKIYALTDKAAKTLRENKRVQDILWTRFALSKSSLS